MKQKVMVRIHSEQHYEGESPEIVEFMSEGTMEQTDGGFLISYEETELTGLQGTTTTILMEKDQISLTRNGTLQSEMIFAIDREYRSLYDMGMAALLITIRTIALVQVVDASGGFADIVYDLIIEDSIAGQVRYHIDIVPI